MPTIDTKTVIWLRDRLHPLLVALAKSKIKYDIEPLNYFHAVPAKPIIFAGNHSTPYDMPIATKATRRRSYVLLGKQSLYFIDRLFFLLNGVIWVDRKDRLALSEAKIILLKYLSCGQSIIWFPEGTWNLTPNLLMLPTKWGIIEVARQADAQIIAMALDYDRGKNLCRVKFAPPITGDDLKDNAAGIRLLRDTMATLRWEMMADQPVLSRADTDLGALKAEVEKAIEEYPLLDWEYEQSCIYAPPNYIAPDTAFEHLRHLIPCRENAFLFRGVSKR